MKNEMKYALCERESDVEFGRFTTKKAAMEELKAYETSDKEHNCYSKDYYEIRSIA